MFVRLLVLQVHLAWLCDRQKCYPHLLETLELSCSLWPRLIDAVQVIAFLHHTEIVGHGSYQGSSPSLQTQFSADMSLLPFLKHSGIIST